MWCRFCVLSEGIDVQAPKLHMMTHVTDRQGYQGNAWEYNTFFDESLNQELKRVMRLCHQAHFEPMVLLKLDTVLANRAKRTRR